MTVPAQVSLSPESISGLVSALRSGGGDPFGIQSALSGDNIMNILSTLVTGRGFQPGQDFTLGSIGNLLGQSKLGQMLGMTDVTAVKEAAKRLSEFYGGPLNKDFLQNQMLFSGAIEKYNQYAYDTRGSIFSISREDTAESLYQLRRYFNKEEYEALNNAKGEEIDSTRLGATMKQLSSTIKVARDILGMGQDISKIINAANMIGGTDNLEENFRTFNQKVANMIKGGMSLQERQSLVAQTIAMRNAYMEKGFSSEAASSYARASMDAGIFAYQASRGGAIYDIQQVQNVAAEQAATWEQGEQAKNTAVALVAADGIKDAEKRKQFLEEVKQANGDSARLNEIAAKYGMQETYDDIWKRSANLTAADLRNKMTSESQRTLDQMREREVASINQKEIDDQVEALKKSGNIYADQVAEAVEIAKKGGILTSEQLRVLDVAGIKGNVIQIQAQRLKENMGKDNAEGLLARYLADDMTKTKFGSDATKYLQELRDFTYTEKDKTTGEKIEKKLNLQKITEDDARQAFLAERKKNLGDKFVLDEGNEAFDKLLNANPNNKALAIADSEGNAIIRDEEGNFVKATKEDLERVAKKDDPISSIKDMMEDFSMDKLLEGLKSLGESLLNMFFEKADNRGASPDKKTSNSQ